MVTLPVLERAIVIGVPLRRQVTVRPLFSCFFTSSITEEYNRLFCEIRTEWFCNQLKRLGFIFSLSVAV